jgi:hypothetical protein
VRVLTVGTSVGTAAKADSKDIRSTPPSSLHRSDEYCHPERILEAEQYALAHPATDVTNKFEVHCAA